MAKKKDAGAVPAINIGSHISSMDAIQRLIRLGC